MWDGVVVMARFCFSRLLGTVMVVVDAIFFDDVWMLDLKNTGFVLISSFFFW